MCFLGRWSLADIVFKEVPCFSRVPLFQWSLRIVSAERSADLTAFVVCCTVSLTKPGEESFLLFSRSQKYILSFIWPLHISKRSLLDKRSCSRWLSSKPYASPKNVTLSWWALKWMQMFWLFWGPLLLWEECFFFKEFLHCT